MKAKRVVYLSATLAIGMFFLMGCATTADEEMAKGPDWFWKGSGVFETTKGKVFRGVGVASGIKNPNLLRATADNRAQRELAEILRRYVGVLSKDYMASVPPGDMSSCSGVLQVHYISPMMIVEKQLVDITTIVERWTHPEDGRLYSLCELDLLSYKKALHNCKGGYAEEGLYSQFLDYLWKNAERVHSELMKNEK
jgi:hypothetical protein